MRHAALIFLTAIALAVLGSAGISRVAGAAPAPDALMRLKNKNPAVRFQVAVELGRVGKMEHTSRLASLLADENAAVREAANRSLWKIWMRSGDSGIDALMKRGVGLVENGQLEKATAVFAEMTQRKPRYAEGWNKRATALWMARRYQESVADCIKVIELNPHHFGALSGLGLNYLGMNDMEAALDAFKRTLEILPYSRSAVRYIEILEKKLSESRKKI